MDIYTLSNSILNVEYNRFSKREYESLLKATESAVERKRLAQKLVDYLCDKYNISHVVVQILDTPQKTFAQGRGKVMGDYTHSNLYKCIRIWNKTAKTHKVVSIKGFADTLLHEFIHHYDYEYLKMGDSLHTKGFYMRISDLKNKLSTSD